MSIDKKETDCDAFDALLENFLDSELELIKLENDKDEHKAGESDDNLVSDECFAPIPECYDIESVSVEYNGGDGNIRVNEFIHSKNKYNIVSYNIEFKYDMWESKVEDRTKLLPIRLNLYQVATGECIYSREIEPMQGDNELNIEFDLVFGPGLYMIELDNCRLDLSWADCADAETIAKSIANDRDEDGGYVMRHHFMIYPNGADVVAPEITSAEVLFPSDVNGGILGSYMDAVVRIAMTSEQKMCRYHVECYSSSGYKIGCSKETSSERQLRLADRSYSLVDSTLSAEIISTDYLWTPDDYFMVFYQNDTPVSRFDFSLKEAVKSLIKCVISSITFESEEYYRYNVFNKSGLYPKLMLECGFENSRKKLARIVEMQEFELSRTLSEEAEALKCKGLAIIGSGANMKEIMTAAAEMTSSMSPSFLDCATLVERSGSGGNLGSTRIEEVLSQRVIALENTSALLCPDGIDPLRRIAKTVMKNKRKQLYILCGSMSEFERLVSMEPLVGVLCPEERCLTFDELTFSDYLHLSTLYIGEKRYTISEDAAAKLYRVLRKIYDKGMLYKVTPDGMRHMIDEFVIKNQNLRKLVEFRVYHDDCDLDELDACDIDETAFCAIESNGFDAAMKPINDMVGLNDLKSRLMKFFARLNMERMRRKMGLPVRQQGFNHMLFTGSPGTGKTTVARIMGKVCHALGILSKGEVVVTDRSHIVGQYIGDTERNMLNILSQAQGNVLFIDEAYTLLSEPGSRDFGNRAIETLLPVLSQNNPDIVVILAGYKDKIDAMLKTNAGLSGRFPHQFEFPDYTAEELIEIGKRYISRKGYKLSVDAARVFESEVTNASRVRTNDFCNARWVEQLVDNGLLSAMAERLDRQGLMHDFSFMSVEALSQIEVEDVRQAVNDLKAQSQPRRSIGF